MEEERREAVLDALGVNPGDFVDEMVNAVGDGTEDALGVILQGGLGGSERNEILVEGIEEIRGLVQRTVGKKLDTWVRFCMIHVFGLPARFRFPDESTESFELSDPDLDNKLDSLRIKLAAAGKEEVELQREMSLLEKQSNFSTGFDASVAKALASYDDNSTQETYKDNMTKLTKLHRKLLEMRNESSNGDAQCLISGPNYSSKEYSTGLEEMEDVLSILRNE